MAGESASGPLISVSTATPADIDDLIPLYCGFMLHEQVQPPPADELQRRLRHLLASETDEVLIARAADGAPLGYLQQRYFASVWRPGNDAYIEDVFVAEPARGQGVGRRLMEAALERASARGAARICLDTNERNLRARRLYEALGFANPNPAWDDGSQLYYSRLL